jgi:hypothetical protein
MKKWDMGKSIHHMKGLLLLLTTTTTQLWHMWSIRAAGRPREGRTGLWNRGGEGPILGLTYYYPFFTWETVGLCAFD